jgi:hypothetical protein
MDNKTITMLQLGKLLLLKDFTKPNYQPIEPKFVKEFVCLFPWRNDQ